MKHILQVLGRDNEPTVMTVVGIVAYQGDTTVGHCTIIEGKFVGKEDAAGGAPAAHAVGAFVGAHINIIGASRLKTRQLEGIGRDVGKLRMGIVLRLVVGVVGVEQVPMVLVVPRHPSKRGPRWADVACPQSLGNIVRRLSGEGLGVGRLGDFSGAAHGSHAHRILGLWHKASQDVWGFCHSPYGGVFGRGLCFVFYNPFGGIASGPFDGDVSGHDIIRRNLQVGRITATWRDIYLQVIHIGGFAIDALTAKNDVADPARYAEAIGVPTYRILVGHTGTTD